MMEMVIKHLKYGWWRPSVSPGGGVGGHGGNDEADEGMGGLFEGSAQSWG